MSTPLINVVIPVHNEYYKYVPECLSSVLGQTYSNWNAVVVDDSSSGIHRAEAVMEGFQDSRIRMIRHARNLGLAAARNTGVKDSSGDFILPLDSDDRLAPTCLERLSAALVAHPGHSVAFSDFQAFDARDGLIQFPIRDVRALLEEQWIPGPGSLFRRTLWERVGGYCEADVLRHGNEDWDFWLSAAEHELRVIRVPEGLYYYRQHAYSMVGRLRYWDYQTREFMYDRHQSLFDRYGMKRVFLSGGYRLSAKASWLKKERRRALYLAARALLLAPSLFALDALRSLSSARLTRPQQDSSRGNTGP